VPVLCGGVCWSLRLAGVCSIESGGWFLCVGAFSWNLASVALSMLSRLI
jgi:hypothetical protein